MQSTSLRRCTQVKLMHHLKDLETEKQIASFVKILADKLNVHTNTLLNKLFLQSKHELSDESLEEILQLLVTNSHDKIDDSTTAIATTTDNTCNSVKTENRLHHCHLSSINLHRTESTCILQCLPRDVFYEIGSYLSRCDINNLMVCNHWLYFEIQTKSFIDACAQKYEFNLSNIKMESIMSTNERITADMFGYEKCEHLIIEWIDDDDQDTHDEQGNQLTVSCTDDDLCIFCNFCDKIDENFSEITDPDCDNMQLDNYDLQWFVKLLNNIHILRLDQSWPCLWSKMPLKWLLKYKSWDTYDLCLTSVRKTFINQANTQRFVLNFERANNILKDNIRHFQTVGFGTSLKYAYAKMNQNYDTIWFPVHNVETFDCSMENFFKVFHYQLYCLSIVLDARCDQFGGANLFFDTDSHLYKGLLINDKTSLNSFKIWIDYQLNTFNRLFEYYYRLPDVRQLHLVMKYHHENLLKFLQNAKLMAVLNLFNTVTYIELIFW